MTNSIWLMIVFFAGCLLGAVAAAIEMPACLTALTAILGSVVTYVSTRIVQELGLFKGVNR